MSSKTHQPKTSVQLPVSRSSKIFIIKDQTYEIFRFREGEKLNLERTISFAESKMGWELLTENLVVELMDDKESNAILKKVLKPGDSTYVHDPDAEGRLLASYLVRSRLDKELYDMVDVRPEDLCRAVILKKIGSEVIAPVAPRT